MGLIHFKIRIIANACVTRYNNGEGEIKDIVDSYDLDAEDKEKVLAYVYFKRPDINRVTLNSYVELDAPTQTNPEHQTGR
ncbi:hypothetical protein P4H65_23335 [Paenibacillus chitinolyticus]|uniref:hypothetical protein n=1 Tax=Paenibacillus chitinolyticus TaxID=79263 RepID=UPI002DB875FF|nr:hypothetical protein [Paenibacillus chitinolyticus]MEC0248728.1 hypothetical protein [Paenibacillus chitinolyticus]